MEVVLTRHCDELISNFKLILTYSTFASHFKRLCDFFQIESTDCYIGGGRRTETAKIKAELTLDHYRSKTVELSQKYSTLLNLNPPLNYSDLPPEDY